VIPQTLAALVAFVALVVPGLAFELLRERRRAAVEETPFREVSRIGVTSACFSSVAITLLFALHAVRPSATVDLAAWLRDGTDYAADNLGSVLGTTLMFLVVATGLAWATDQVLRGRAEARIVGGSIWFSVFRVHRPEGARPWVHLRLSDETEIWGYAGDYSPEQKLENRELLVEGGGLQYRRKGATEATPLPDWSFIAVRGDSITWMKVQYLEPQGQEGTRLVPAVYPQARWATTVQRLPRPLRRTS